MNISQWITRWSNFTPNKTAIRFEGKDLSYADFEARNTQIASVLYNDFRVQRGDRIAFLGFNSPEMLGLLFACARLGAVLVPLNWRLASPEHLFILNHSGAKVLFCEEEFTDGINSIASEVEACRIVKMGAEYEMLLSSSEKHFSGSRANADDPILIVYTSGTTGRPKGAVLTQNALIFNAINSVSMHDMTSEDLVFTNLPMFHVGGLNIQTTPAIQAGATVILHRRFELNNTVEVINKDKPTLMILVPALMAAMIQSKEWKNIDFSSLRTINTGSTTVPPSLIDAFHDRGVPIIQVFGSTETAPIAIHQRIPDAFSTVGSTGRAALYCEAKIVDKNGDELGPEERGEILVRGPNIMSGYWDDPVSSAAVLKNGWFHTGDIGHKDLNGLFYIDDRLKDVIISGSENIYPAEIELILDSHSEIAESAVVGRPDDTWGEVPVAIVVLASGSAFNRESVLNLFDGKLARFKHPRDVIFKNELPRNVMGKVQKFKLREMVCAH